MKKLDLLGKGYGINPKSVWLETDISLFAKAVISYFLSYTGAGKIECWPSMETICLHVGISDNTARKAIRELENIGWIESGKLSSNPMNHQKKYKLTIIESEEDIKDYDTSSGEGTSFTKCVSLPHSNAVSSIREHEHIEQKHSEQLPVKKIKKQSKSAIEIKALFDLSDTLQGKYKETFRKWIQFCLNNGLPKTLEWHTVMAKYLLTHPESNLERAYVSAIKYRQFYEYSNNQRSSLPAAIPVKTKESDIYDRSTKAATKAWIDYEKGIKDEITATMTPESLTNKFDFEPEYARIYKKAHQ